MGTNPISYGYKDSSGDIRCVDMDTSEATYFEIMNANASNSKLRKGTAVDTKGELTLNSNEALDFSKSKTDPISNLTPIGNSYKGYYIVFLMELLTSALIVSPSAPEMSSDFVAKEHGSLIIVFSLDSLGTKSSFLRTLDVLHSEFNNQTPKEGIDNIEIGKYYRLLLHS